MSQKNQYRSLEKEIFHVHTYRCKHAAMVSDYEYVEKALELGAPRIVFTEHCPFPDNPFDYRMDMDELPGYVESIKSLARKYEGRIEVLCGLEIEYLPSYYDYFKSLKDSGDYDLFILGQHFFEYSRGHYDIHDKDRSMSYIGMCNAMVEGIATGLFEVVAHPDRVFRQKEVFDSSAMKEADKVIHAALDADIYLEKNFTSMNSKHFYWQEFWDMLPANAKVLYGIDAHAPEDIYFIKRLSHSER